MNDDMLDREVKQTEKEINLEKYKTANKKIQFINAVKNGLGDEIKKNPNKVKIIQKTPFQKFMVGLKKLFTRF